MISFCGGRCTGTRRNRRLLRWTKSERDQHRWGRARPVSRRQREEGSSPSVRDEILTTEEVCALLKIKKATLYRHTSQRTGPPFYKIGKHNRWKRSEVMDWLDSHLHELSRSGQ